MVDANTHDGPFHHLVSSTVGVIFLGTPHRGSEASTWGGYVAACAKEVGLGSEDSILKDLRQDSESLRDTLYNFTLLVNKMSILITCFFEQHETDYLKRFGLRWKQMVGNLWSGLRLCTHYKLT